MGDKIVVKNRGTKIKINVKKTNLFSRFFGLMFKSKNTENLLFDFGRDVNISFHSIFVFFPFVMLWLDSKNNVLNCRVVQPFNVLIKIKERFRKVIEIPFNERNRGLIRKFRNL